MSLYASSGSEDGIKKLIAEYYYNQPENISLVKIDEHNYEIYLKGKIIDTMIVKRMKKRFRFEDKVLTNPMKKIDQYEIKIYKNSILIGGEFFIDKKSHFDVYMKYLKKRNEYIDKFKKDTKNLYTIDVFLNKEYLENCIIQNGDYQFYDKNGKQEQRLYQDHKTNPMKDDFNTLTDRERRINMLKDMLKKYIKSKNIKMQAEILKDLKDIGAYNTRDIQGLFDHIDNPSGLKKAINGYKQFNWRNPDDILKGNLPIYKGQPLIFIGVMTELQYKSDKVFKKYYIHDHDFKGSQMVFTNKAHSLLYLYPCKINKWGIIS